ncbi:glycosyltransferase family 1 protein [ANME-1 cluster archaeon AG-394-G06]|nr:glycosyltransferase family 1 protein [ANME-1 cluster archaeon AG-394-G06]
MRILHLTKKYPDAFGGDAVIVSNLEREQTKLGHKISILTPNCPEIREQENVFKFGLRDKAPNLDRLTVRRFLSLFILFFSGFKYLGKLKPDVIHTHSADLGFFIAISAKLYHIPVVNTCHGVSFPDKQYSFIKRFAERFFLKYAGFKRIIVVDRNILIFFEGAGIKNGVYIPNGVDIGQFAKEEAVIKADKKVRFLFVGRLEEQKGCGYLIQATRILKAKTQDFVILLVGDGSQRAILENLTEENNLGHYVTFLGSVEDEKLRELYCTSDVFILPSIWEGLPVTLLEAWSAKLPVIVTTVGAIRDICVDERNGLVVRPKDPAGIADAMLRLIEDEELRMRLAKNGAELVRHEFSLERVLTSTLELYEEVII